MCLQLPLSTLWVIHHLLLCCLQVLLLLSTGFIRAHPDLMAQAAVEVLGLCLVRAPYANINHAAQAAAKLHVLLELFTGQQAAALPLRRTAGLCRTFYISSCEACLVLGVLSPVIASPAAAVHPFMWDVT